MKKERLWISGLAIVISILILLGSLAGRITYENESQQAFLSVNMSELTAQGRNTTQHLKQLKDTGVQVVTVEPLTVKGLEAKEKLNLISYSSVSDSENVMFVEIGNILKDYPLSPNNQIALVTDPAVKEYLKQELSYRYDDYLCADLTDGVTTVFAFQNLTPENDLIVGYDNAELELIKQLNLSVAAIYPSYTFENTEYPEHFKQFVRQNNVSFLVLRENPFDNEQALSQEMKAMLRTLDITLVVWENASEIGNEMPYLYTDLFSVMKSNTLRGFHSDKLSNQSFDAVTERNIKFIEVGILSNLSLDADADFALTLQEISDFQEDLDGYRFEKKAKAIPYSYSDETVCMASGILLLSLVYVYLLLVLKKIPPYFTEGYFGLMIASAIFSYALASSLTGVYAFAITVVSTGLSGASLFYLEKNKEGRKKYLWMVLSSVAILIVGCAAVSALLGGSSYHTATKLYNGAIISAIVSFVLAIINVYFIYFADIYSVKKIPDLLWNWLKRGGFKLFLPIVAGIVLTGAYALLRMVNDAEITAFENSVQQWLTHIFYIRPKWEEVLLGYPLLALFYYFSITRTTSDWKFFFGICSTLLFVSVLNTFSSATATVSVHLQRFFNGLISGLLVCLIVIGILLVIRFMPSYLKKLKEARQEKEAKEPKDTEPKEPKESSKTKKEKGKKEITEKTQTAEETEESIKEEQESAEESDDSKEDLVSSESEVLAENVSEKETQPDLKPQSNQQSGQNNQKNQKKQNNKNNKNNQKNQKNKKNPKQGSKAPNPKYPVKKSGKKKTKKR